MQSKTNLLQVIDKVKEFRLKSAENEMVFRGMLINALQKGGWNQNFREVGLVAIKLDKHKDYVEKQLTRLSDPDIFYDIALQFFKMSFLMNAADWTSLFEIGATLLGMKRHEEACYFLSYLYENKLDFRETSLDMNNKRLLRYNLALALFGLNRLEEAIEFLAKLTEEEPHNVVVLDHLAQSYGKTCQFERAIALWERVLKIDPSREWAEHRITQTKILANTKLSSIDGTIKLDLSLKGLGIPVKDSKILLETAEKLGEAAKKAFPGKRKR